MFSNLAVGSSLVAITVLLHTGGLLYMARLMPAAARALKLHTNDMGRSLVMMMSVLGIFALHTGEVWIWAETYDLLHCAGSFPDALILSTDMFSTIGYGGVSVTPNWQLLAALEGINGFILIGWSTAYLVGVSTRHGPFRNADNF